MQFRNVLISWKPSGFANLNIVVTASSSVCLVFSEDIAQYMTSLSSLRLRVCLRR